MTKRPLWYHKSTIVLFAIIPGAIAGIIFCGDGQSRLFGIVVFSVLFKIVIESFWRRYI